MSLGRLAGWSALLAAGVAPCPAACDAMLQPGAVYHEYRQVMRGDNWRVTHPGAVRSFPQAEQFLPNPVLSIQIDDLAGAVRAEAVIDFWGGHYRTSDKKVRFNGNAWIPVPELKTTPAGGLPSSYMQQFNPVIEIPLSHLKEGDNSFEGACGDQINGFGWGQWGWYGIVLRVYYDARSKPHPTGRITSPSRGRRLTENPTLNVSAHGEAGVKRVDFFGRYEGYDENGDGIYREWHHNYHYDVLGDHIGTAISPPYQTTWRTRWVPDQPEGSISLVARIQDGNGIWYVTEPVEGLSLDRATTSVRLHPPSGVPEVFWAQGGATKSCRIAIPPGDDLGRAVEASLHLRTWNGLEEDVKLNDWSDAIAGANHNYAYTIRPVPASLLKHDNVVTFHSETQHHGVEILWPGPALVVRYSKGRPRRPGGAYRLPIAVSAAGQERCDKPVEVALDFSALQAGLGVTGRFNDKSIRVVEVNDRGNLVDASVECQFDRDPSYDSATRARGILVILMRGSTKADAIRRFQVYFGGRGSRSPLPVVHGGIAVAEVSNYQGQDSFRIEAESAVYYYHKAGGGFASLLDRNGRDWISFRPGGRASGQFRGIPNVIYPEGGFHPGSDRCISRLLGRGPIRARIHSQTADGKWACVWDIYPRYARLTLLKADHPYWFLYEGTPAGKLEEQNQYWVRSDGQGGSASDKWQEALPDPGWVYFGEAQGLNRVVYLAQHEADGQADSYWPMDSAMTVLGFGRDNSRSEHRSCMTLVPAHFTIGLAETGRTADVQSVILSACRDLSVLVGAPEAVPGSR